MKTIVRFAKKEDMYSLIDLCEAHAIYEEANYSKKGKAAQLEKDLFCKTPKLCCLVVEAENELVGYATYMKQYATWDAKEYTYMDCLFLKENMRGFVLGEKLVDKNKRRRTKIWL